MSLIRLLSSVNSKIGLLGGGFLNVLMMFIICTKTPVEMQIYSKILLQTCVLDICNLVLDELVQPFLFTQNGTAHVISSGVAGQLPYPWNIIIYLFWLFSASFIIVGLLLQFLFRYLILCKGFHMTTTIYAVMLLSAVSLHGGIIASVWFIATPARNAIERDPLILRTLGLNESILLLVEGIGNGTAVPPPEIRLVSDGSRRNLPWILFHLAFDSVNFGAYAIMIYTGREMRKHVNRQIKIKTGKLAELSRQLTLTLIIQATIPVVALVGWTYCFYTCVIGDILPPEWNNLFSAFFFNAPQVWISVMNPLVTLMTVKPYKKAFGQILRNLMRSHNSNDRVVPIQ